MSETSDNPTPDSDVEWATLADFRGALSGDISLTLEIVLAGAWWWAVDWSLRLIGAALVPVRNGEPDITDKCLQQTRHLGSLAHTREESSDDIPGIEKLPTLRS